MAIYLNSLNNKTKTKFVKHIFNSIESTPKLFNKWFETEKKFINLKLEEIEFEIPNKWKIKKKICNFSYLFFGYLLIIFWLFIL